MEPFLFDNLPEGPFQKLRQLIENVEPKQSFIDMSIGEPKHDFPAFIKDALATAYQDFGKYPPAIGSQSLRETIASWTNKRFDLNGQVDADKHVVVLNGTREGLFYAGLMAIKPDADEKPIFAMPDPFYQVYASSAIAGRADILFMPTPAQNGFMPDLDAISEVEWQRMAAFFICSPANPQGAFADAAYYERLLELAEKHDFYIFSDECYSEIYSDEAPISALNIAAKDKDFKRVISFFSLSKRSSLPGLRSGFCAGDADFMRRFKKMRNVAAPQVPLPLQKASEYAWADEAHVVENRDLYNQKLDLADEILSGMFEYYRPKGGFFLWLDMAKYGGGVKACHDLYEHCGIKALPGAYLSSLHVEEGDDPSYGDMENETAGDYLRVALVNDIETTKIALMRIKEFYLNWEENHG